jgi:2-dehydropantoate 2-reductase
MEIVVVGAGAIGGALAGYLAGAGHDVTALDEWLAHVDAINRDGLLVSGARGENRFRLRAVLWSDIATLALKPKIVFVSVKTYDTERAARLVAPILTPETVVLSTQNGINEDLLGNELGRDRIIGAVTEIGGYMVGAGEIVETRAGGGFVIGELDGNETVRARDVQRVMSACAPTTITPTIRNLLWSKLTWNCMMNPITALTGRGQGEVWTTPSLRELTLAVGREAAAVARADGTELEPLTFLGVDLPGLLSDSNELAQATKERVIKLYRRQIGKSTSMLEDTRNGRRTEVDSLNGYVFRRGEQFGVPVERNRALTHLVHLVEKGEAVVGDSLVDNLSAPAGV